MGYFETMSGRDMQIEAKVLMNSKFEFLWFFVLHIGKLSWTEIIIN